MLTIQDLHDFLCEQISKGHGQAPVLVAVDARADYHAASIDIDLVTTDPDFPDGYHNSTLHSPNPAAGDFAVIIQDTRDNQDLYEDSQHTTTKRQSLINELARLDRHKH